MINFNTREDNDIKSKLGEKVTKMQQVNLIMLLSERTCHIFFS